MDADADTNTDTHADSNIGGSPGLGPTVDNIQAHLLRASKFRGGRTRNWSLFVFFRIMAQAEIEATKTRLIEFAESPGSEAFQQTLLFDLAYPRAANAGLVESLRESSDAGAEAAAPAKPFLNWLNALVNKDGQAIKASVEALLKALPQPKTAKGRKALAASLAERLESPSLMAARMDLGILQEVAAVVTSKPAFDNLLKGLNDYLEGAAAKGRKGPLLPPLLACEFARQAAPVFGSKERPSTIRSEWDQAKLDAHGPGRGRSPGPEEASDRLPDATPITLAFTYSGLEALQLHEPTLRSFPDAFKEGMAARAGRLKDVGASAPEHWEGELGLKSVHGYMTGGFGTHDYPATEAFWKQVRAEIRAFNDGTDPDDVLRKLVGGLFRGIGLEVVHIELGQDPDQVEDDKAASLCPFAGRSPRREHFGFRDGLSQPFADLGLDDPGPGSGTPARQGTWTPVAPGEIFLDRPDEDGDLHGLPVNDTLRAGSTFLVFRKLEQDVPGFRSFLKRQRNDRDDDDDEAKAREALAAQMMGRWKDGTPLVRSPYHPAAQDGPEAPLNDFRYAEDDPRGERCPLGAHIRRANPRDIGGRNEVRRHRILRRGISYGGPLLPEGSLGDGEKRGMLFIAANARIDLQFEVIQGDWLNGGEFLGQAGLDKCPVTGASAGGVADRFLEAGAGAPITGLPRFVTTRGGDYFFAPGIAALRRIVKRDDFHVPPGKLPFGGYSMGDAYTPSLFSTERIAAMTTAILGGQQRIFRLGLPESDKFVSFVGLYADVKTVLENAAYNGKIHFSVRPYRDASRRITRGQDMVIGTEHVGDTKETRQRMMTGLDLAWKTLGKAFNCPDDNPERLVRQVVREQLAMALRRTGPARRIDLVADLASQAAYGVLTNVYGAPGPAWVTELGAALPFSKAHVGSLPADWLAAFRGEKLADPGLTTMKVWTALLVADLIGNVQSQAVVQGLSRQAGSEMLTHIDSLLLAAKARMAKKPTPPVRTLIDAYVANWAHPEIQRLYAKSGPELYAQDTALVLLEILGSTLAVIPLMFASVMTLFLDNGVDLSALLKLRRVDYYTALNRLIYEAERLNPNMAVRMRLAEVDQVWGTEKIAQEDPVAAMVVAANLDPRVFFDPRRFSLDGLGLPGQPKRDPKKYLTFGVRGSQKDCWGAGRVAMPVLEECLDAATRLAGLRRVAGPTGEPQKLAGVTIGLRARFSRVDGPQNR